MSDTSGVARAPVTDVTASKEWADLAAHHRAMTGTTLRTLFDGDSGRAAQMGRQAGDLYVDFSKHLVTDETIDLLVRLAQLVGLEQRRDAMFAGEHINTTEDRAVLHVALRLPADATLVVDGQDVVADVHRVLGRMGQLADQIRSGAWTGHTGRRIRTVVNIGIGGSDLGPAMAYQALGDFTSPDVSCRFVSNVDPLDLWNQTHDLDPAETLFVVCSKTFTTLETMTNAAAARRWVLEGLGVRSGDDAGRADAVAKHFVAVSANLDAVAKFGIDTDNMLEFWDWVGGRYSFDSAIGFAVMVAIGPSAFGEMLAGFHLVDEHFRTTPLHQNVPVLQGLFNVWYRNFFGFQSHTVLPYSQRLARFPAYLQQLTMESNGKSVRRDGTPVQDQTGEVYWGEPGTNGQHAFYQLLHQGTTTVPADFIAFAEPAHDNGDQHHLLMANCFAQSAVLAFGRTAEEVAAEGTAPDVVPHKVMPGNRPSSTILAPRLTPSVLGQLVALYEHTVFTEGAIWGIDSFDQWGVELGKAMASQLVPALVTHDDGESSQLLAARGSDSSTTGLVARYRELRG
jgi:glucose-6-phosphate isomerase